MVGGAPWSSGSSAAGRATKPEPNVGAVESALVSIAAESGAGRAELAVASASGFTVAALRLTRVNSALGTVGWAGRGGGCAFSVGDVGKGGVVGDVGEGGLSVK